VDKASSGGPEDFGAVPPAAVSVFINCPFDKEFAPLFDAIIFSVVSCGFVPRSTLESGTTAEPRIRRIGDALLTSNYSIHDLSRCKGEGDENLARFNMPLELGMAMACRLLAKETEGRHDWLVLVPTGHQYVRFVSDLAGFDPEPHDGTEVGVVARVMTWLASRPNTKDTPTPRQVLEALPVFRAERTRLTGEWAGSAPWRQVLLAARRRAPISARK
jgi:hypothetical protein